VLASLHMAYRVLKNAGFIPPEVSLWREIASLADLLCTIEDTPECSRAEKRLNYLLTKLGAVRGCNSTMASQQAYYDRLIKRMG